MFMVFLTSVTYCSAQEPNFLDNPITLLRQLRVNKILEDSTFEYKLEHYTDRTRISYQEQYYEYLNSDSANYQEITDSILIFIDSFEDHYFNVNNLIDSSFYFTSYLDSIKMDTSRILRYSYYPSGELLQIRELTYWLDTVLTQYEYHRTGKRIDSIFEYSNVTTGTFGPTSHDTLQLIQKLKFSYDLIGRKTEKLKYWGSKVTVIESYDYPNENTVVITKSPYYPLSGCIQDQSISYSPMTVLYYDQKGLIQGVVRYERIKKQNEDNWRKRIALSYGLTYELK